jgi:8-oxo-dGTP pyrophosphatase MutT (NUDIX family)
LAADPEAARVDQRPDRLTEAAVLVPVLRRDGGPLRLVLIRRAAGGIHGGQLAFPGGKREPQDASLQDTALREAHEEIGIARRCVTVLASLSPVETLATGFRIHPFLGWVEPPALWQFHDREVQTVLELEVAELAALQAAGTPSEDPRADCIPPYCRIGNDRLWGASYRIAEQVLPRLAAGEWKL